MLTADRTSIRRRLAVRRRTNGPPWGGVKRGHDAILAPLAASIAITLTAALLVGLGVALVRDERDRRAQGARRSRARQFGLVPGERPAAGLRRMALGQLDLAIELLDADRGRPPSAAAVHDTRKALKRLRALVRTLRPELGEQAYARENAVLRRCARRLSAVRDAEVMVGTLDQLLVRNRSQLAHLGAVRRLRAQFAAERDRAQRNALTDSATLRETASELRAVRERVAAWELRGRGMRVASRGCAASTVRDAGASRAPGAGPMTGARFTCGENGSRTCATPRKCSTVARRAPTAAPRPTQQARGTAGAPSRRAGCAGWRAAPTASENCWAKSTTWRCWPSACAPPTSRSRTPQARARRC